MVTRFGVRAAGIPSVRLEATAHGVCLLLCRQPGHAMNCRFGAACGQRPGRAEEKVPDTFSGLTPMVTRFGVRAAGIPSVRLEATAHGVCLLLCRWPCHEL